MGRSDSVTSVKTEDSDPLMRILKDLQGLERLQTMQTTLVQHLCKEIEALRKSSAPPASRRRRPRDP